MLEALKQDVYEANMELVERNLVISTWGNVSGYDEETGYMVIKASGVHYKDLGLEHMIVVDMDGHVVEGDYRPSTDTMTHIAIYKAFKDKGIRGCVHTHSQNATMWAQLGRDIPCYGTTHCDYFYGPIPCTRILTQEEIDEGYEVNTGKIIVERFKDIDPVSMQAVLVAPHGPFTWGKSPKMAVLHSHVLDYIAKMARDVELMSGGPRETVPDRIRNKHYDRKFGKDAYYGQN